MTIKVICAWCNKALGTKEGGKAPGEVSHGICKECGDKLIKETMQCKTKST